MPMCPIPKITQAISIHITFPYIPSRKKASTGNMDLDSLMAQALSVGVDAVILESHRNWVDNSPIKSLQVSAEYLKQHC